MTSDMSELFGLLFHDPLDARWLAALPARQLEQLGTLLGSEPEPRGTPGDRPASRLQRLGTDADGCAVVLHRTDQRDRL